ncbi:MAG: dihydropteroate synthase [Leptospiraceae bacterium]|nr:dihydropteroate synthase [Leptospiraceae bacterium]MDW8306803.1 dihydropteroate synthase [Leptospiraceae bacterium]
MWEKEKLLPEIWGIINLSEDSFYPPSRTKTQDIIKVSEELLKEGADMLDLGAESTRPGSRPISWQEEIRKLKEALLHLRQYYGQEFLAQKVSVDTYKREVAAEVLSLGVRTINDIKAGRDRDMLQLVANAGAQIVLMHMQNEPYNMQDNPTYQDVVAEVMEFLDTQTRKALDIGVRAEKIIWDYGIGFGKTLEHNLKLLAATPRFLEKGFRLLVGVSRKSFLGKLLDIPEPEERREASLVVHTYLALKGVSILRTHDVRDAWQMRCVLKALMDHAI